VFGAALVALALAADVSGTKAPAGLYMGAGVGAGVVGGDVVLATDIALGIESAPFSLHLRAPPTLRLFDLPPLTSPSLPSTCRIIRCEEALSGERLDPTAFARVVDEVRLFQPGDVVHARAGRLSATIGAGAAVDRLTTMASWDRRTSGAYAALRLPWQRFTLELLTADVVSPLELMAGRGEGEVTALLGAPVIVGGEVAVDAFAPVDATDAGGAVRPGAQTRPLGAAVVDARLLLGEGGVISGGPRLELSAMTGLAGGAAIGDVPVGGGAAVGGEGIFKVAFVDVRGLAMAGWSSPGHRRGVFQTFHLVERRRVLAGGAVDDATLLGVAAPGGASLDVRLDASVLDVVAPIVRVHLEPTPGGNAVEAGVVVDADPVTVSVAAIRRGFIDAASLVGPDLERVPLLLAAEASWRVWGPLSMWARWYRLPRFSRERGLSVDDDVLAGVSVNGAIVPAP